MESINSFFELFTEVWNKGIFGLNASEIIIGFLIYNLIITNLIEHRWNQSIHFSNFL